MSELKVQDFHGKQVIDNLPLMEECVKDLIEIAFANPGQAMKLVDIPFSQVETPWIEFCVRRTIMDFLTKSFPTEKDVYEWFRKHYQEVLGDCWTIVNRKSNPKHIPDFWISNGDSMVPVECKLMEFNSKSLKQLQHYMEFYGCSSGVAVAKKCTCELPENIIFVPFVEPDSVSSFDGNKEVQV